MSRPENLLVYRQDDGLWANKRLDADRPSSMHDTKEQAIDAAKEMLLNEGGRELLVKELDGTMRLVGMVWELTRGVEIPRS